MVIAERALIALLLLLLYSCVSPFTAINQTVIGTISVSAIKASTRELMGAVGGVYEVRPLEGAKGPVLLIIETPCPFFQIANPDQNNPSQVYRIEFRSSERTRETMLSPSDPAHLQTDNVTVKCELVEKSI